MYGGSEAYLAPGQWELTTSYLRFVSNKHYIGTNPNTRLTPYLGPVNTRNQLNFDLSYGLTHRWSLGLDVPIQAQSYNLHRALPGSTTIVPIHTGANGIGDITVRAGYWLFSTEQARGNLNLSTGLEMPTGDSDAASNVYGQYIPVDISVQPGTGGWAIVPTLQAFRGLGPVTVYGVATYAITPQNTDGVPSFFPVLFGSRNPSVNSIADQFLFEAGASFATPLHWLSPTLGYRVSGVPVNDLIGGSDGFRRPATLNYIEPGVNITLFGRTLNLSVPVVTYIDVKPRIVNGVNANTDATVPDYMFTLTYSFRFGRGRGSHGGA